MPAYPDATVGLRSLEPALRSLSVFVQAPFEDVLAHAEARNLNAFFERTDKRGVPTPLEVSQRSIDRSRDDAAARELEALRKLNQERGKRYGGEVDPLLDLFRARNKNAARRYAPVVTESRSLWYRAV
ncbi:hypothetical protein AWB91_24555 [Mycobacterium paraense]|uniref:Uncharacterized protein n=2 Tax=Mycobacterium paraense TaxID=767916 RepID=A0ABX3VIW4_9MYCO|nr:hypothetical protein AWB91_24555 [Mycobacterium paraense]ORW40357.1 hypothetical protein AWB88_13560 [Mycobacterium paraense]